MFGLSGPPFGRHSDSNPFRDATAPHSLASSLPPPPIPIYAPIVVQSGSALVYDPCTCMDQSEPNLKVTDRRHFTAEGELKAEASSSPQDADEVASPKVQNAPPAPETWDAHPVSFSSFIVSLATQAADYIGGDHKDLGAARQMISALEMLKDKSEGRRTDEENRIIEAVLFDLRLAFVGATKGSRA